MYLPIPSLDNRYEINPRGYVRNSYTKHILKPDKTKSVHVQFRGKCVHRSVAKLLWEVHGVLPKWRRRPFQNPVTLRNGGDAHFFDSFTKAAIFLHRKLFYSYDWIFQQLTARKSEIFGYDVHYHKQIPLDEL